MNETPFSNVESAQHYVALLREAVDEARLEIEQDIATEACGQDDRHLDALRLVRHKLTQLEHQLAASARLMNDLKMLRRVLLGESLV